MECIATEVRRAAARVGTQVEELSPTQLRRFRAGVQARFLDPANEKGPLWERVLEDVSVREPEGWRWISSVPLVGRAILFFEEREEPSGFMFISGADVIRTLAESPGFEFYLTDEKTSFLVTFNHHDYLSAMGSAVPWLLALMRRPHSVSNSR